MRLATSPVRCNTLQENQHLQSTTECSNQLFHEIVYILNLQYNTKEGFFIENIFSKYFSTLCFTVGKKKKKSCFKVATKINITGIQLTEISARRFWCCLWEKTIFHELFISMSMFNTQIFYYCLLRAKLANHPSPPPPPSDSVAILNLT